MNEDYNEKIEKYYSDSHFFYRYLWGNKKNLAMHFGFWDKSTKNLNDALINENRYVAEALGIKKDDNVLDAGCGIGGTAIWIAKNYGARVTGISIVKNQIELAKNYAKGRGVDSLIKFEVRDFCDTGLPDESFDKIYAMESACHTEKKIDFLQEVFRLLKKGGKLVVCDGFLAKDKLTKQDEKYYQELCEGWAIPNLAPYKSFNNDLEKVGFKNIKFIKATDKVIKSSQEMYKSAKFIHPLVVFLEKIGLTAKTNVLAEIACKAQYHIFEERIGIYGIFMAQK